MKKNHLLITAAISCLLIIFNINIELSSYIPVQKVISSTVSLSFVGDLMCHLPQISYAKTSSDSFNFNPTFNEIKPFLEKPDLLFGNFETIVMDSGKKFSGYPRFSSPRQFLESIKNVGFDVLFTSNNHAMDMGKKGIISNINLIKEFGMISIGTFKSKKDRDSVRILELKGVKIGLQSYTYGLNGFALPEKENYLINLIDTNIIRNDIKNIQNCDPDLIIIYFHFGDEYSRKPTLFQREIVKKTIEYGADIIVASHPHVVETIEKFIPRHKKLNTGIAAYSLGNFISNQRWRYSDAGAILNFQITKYFETDSLSIDKISVIPTWVFKGKVGKNLQYRILPADTSYLKPLPDYLTREDFIKIKQSYDDYREIFGDYFVERKSNK